MAVRRLGGLALGVLSLGVVGAGLAWACTPQAQLFVKQTAASPGERVELSGRNYPPGQVVRIRWNSLTGQKLATVDLPDDKDSFETSVRIPANVGPGEYVILGIPSSGVRAFGANQATAGRDSILVKPAPTGNPPVGGQPSPDRGQPNRPDRGQPNRPDRRRSATSSGARDISGRGDRGERNRPDRGRSATSPGARDISGRDDRVPAVSISEGRAAPGLGASRAGFPESQAPKSSGIDPSPSPGTTPGGTAPGDRQSEGKSGGRSVWKRPRAGEAPSLTPDRDEQAATDPGPNPGLAIGAGLLGFGLVALFVGFAVAEVRRRRLAGAARPPDAGVM